MRVHAAGFTGVENMHVYVREPASNVIGQFEGPPATQAVFVHVNLQMRQADW